MRRILEASLALALVATGCDTTKNTYYVLDLSAGPIVTPTPKPSCSAGDKQCIDVDVFRLCDDEGTWGADQLCPDGTLCDKGSCVSPAPSAAPCFPGDTECAPNLPNVILTCRAAGDGYDVSDCPGGTACDPASFACAGACGPVGATTCNATDLSKIDTCNGNVITTTSCPSGQLCVTDADGVDGCAPADCDPRTTCVVCGNPTNSKLDPGSVLSFCSESVLGYKWESLNCPAPNNVCDPKGGGACAEVGAGAFNATCTVAVGAVCTPGQTRCTADFLGVQTCNDKGQWAAAAACSAAKNEVCQLTPDGSQFVCGDEACSVATGACVVSGGVSKIRLCDSTGHLAATASACNGHCVTNFGTDDNGDTAGDCIPDCQDGESRCVAAGVTGVQSCTGGVWSAAINNCQSDGGVGVVRCIDSTDPDTSLRHAFCGQCQPGTHRCTNSTGGVDAGASFPFIETCAADGTWSGAPVQCAIGVCAGVEGAAACRVQCVPSQTLCLGTQFDIFDEAAPLYFGFPASLPCNADGTLPAIPDCIGDPAATGCCQPNGAEPTSCRKDAGGHALGCVECVGSTRNEYGLVDTRCTDVTGAQQDEAINFCGDTDHVATESCKSDNTWGPPTQCETGLTCLDPLPPNQRRTCQPCANGESGTDACTASNLEQLGYSGCGDPLLNAGAGYGSTVTCNGLTDCCQTACQLSAGSAAICIADGDC